ncbi:Putative auto-transporter adhesin, head GIN domain [Tangfeifania diversioriginum]|uniref:Putative auto-transporter adhesin, head GIN domain n=1 Tax=Tangfeifania diversioriginum TaxID=1168035 RepID=A0A1M6L0Z4_9BACT|nr:head GIN domain-containing protein [Tangfeifania diversioriginum]SHJ64794.1 Putative auto-transporter adhesin, head GIN domain [Tangfeifania diversioriginum]
MKPINQIIALASIAMLFFTTGCINELLVDGNGISATEARITPDFSKIKSEGEFDIHITHGNEFDILVEAESNLIQYIETDVSGNTLRIHTRGLRDLKNSLPMEIFITVPFIEEIKQSGSGTITTDFFEGNHFEFVISGSGSIETAIDANSVDGMISGSGALFVSGTAKSADFVISGSGQIDAWDMELQSCEATISGSGSMWLTVEQFLKAIISGSGSVYYSGTPEIETRISGSGNIFNEN